MRGTLHGHTIRALQHGIIPAYAGNTADSGDHSRRHGDHPRVCGEHYERKRLAHQFQGSSPRMRGTRTVRESQGGTVGIIPAYAGNTTSRTTERKPWRDHPRVCGEHHSPSPDGSSRPGSSPRMRGTHRRNEREIVRRGIIPAYAGNTRVPFHLLRAERDHPRVCGEHATVGVRSAEAATSSPRMRGTREAGRTGRGTRGIIPAYAGNTG